MNNIRKILSGLDCPTGTSVDFVALDYDNVYTKTIKTVKDILEFVQISKDIIDAGYDDENEVNIATLVTT
ncbi:hypothetical protein TNCV_296391 [Trichonephila clavipes]|nr:hypothetical protein TNCV_296391 [Trichonephila clavipes]